MPGDTGGTWNKINGIGWRWELCIGNGTAFQSSTVGSWFDGQYYHSTPNQVNFLDSTSNELGITGVQVEVGSRATPFEHESYPQTLAKSPPAAPRGRFEAVYTNGPTGTGTSAIPMWFSGDLHAHTRFELPVRMRTSPSASFIGNESAGTASQGTYVTGDNGTIGVFYIGAWQSNDTWAFAATETTENSVRVNAGNLPRGLTGMAGGLYFYGSASTATVILHAEL